MNSLQKRVLLFCISALLMMMLTPNIVHASEKDTKDNTDYDNWMEEFYNGTCGYDVKWHYDEDGTLTISGTGAIDDYISQDNLTPHRVYDYNPNQPWSGWNINKLVIKEGVTGIGDGAFYGCKISEIYLPNTITYIGNAAFWGNSSIQNITLPDSITYIGAFAFENTSLKEIKIPESVGWIGDYALWGLTIYGKSGTEAERYALDNDNSFVSDEKFKVVFKNEDGTVLSEQTVTYGEAAKEPETPKKASDNYYTYEFAGWDAEYDGWRYVFSCVRKDLVVTATYTQRDRYYTVVFKDEDGTVLSEQAVRYGDAANEPERPKKKSDNDYIYEFNRWDTDFSIISSDLVVTAEYTQIQRYYKVVFKDENGKVLSEQTVEYEHNAQVPESPSKKSTEQYEYIFLGWNKKCTNVKSDLVITALYQERLREYTVTFDAAGGNVMDSATLSVGYGTKLGTLPKCTRSGYQFRGWYTGPKKGEEVTATTEVNGDMVVYAHWHSLKPEKVNVKVGPKIGKLPQISFKTYLGNVSGYEIQYSTSEDYSSEDTAILPLKDSYKLSKILGGVIKGKNYYVRARAISYEKDSTGNYVYGDWSNSIKL